jgi:flagellar basal body rod protein FlgG
MNYGFYLSAAGTLASMHRQDVLANNLANVNTIGFKPDEVFMRQRLPARLDRAEAVMDPDLLMEQLGGGALVEPTSIRLTQGTLVKTDAPLDVAIRGDGFLVVSTGSGRGAQHLRLTRDGRLTLDRHGELVMAATGMPVLDVNDRPIRLRSAAGVEISASGEVRQDGLAVARLQVIASPPASQLSKAGNNLLRSTASGLASRRPAPGALAQGHVESSAVDPIMGLNAMINAAKAVQANARMMQYHDHLMDQAINTFGRVA